MLTPLFRTQLFWEMIGRQMGCWVAGSFKQPVWGRGCSMSLQPLIIYLFTLKNRHDSFMESCYRPMLKTYIILRPRDSFLSLAGDMSLVLFSRTRQYTLLQPTLQGPFNENKINHIFGTVSLQQVLSSKTLLFYFNLFFY